MAQVPAQVWVTAPWLVTAWKPYQMQVPAPVRKCEPRTRTALPWPLESRMAPAPASVTVMQP